MTFKEDLKGKIATKEEFDEILAKHRKALSYGTCCIGGISHKQTWWAYREQCRINEGIYTLTPPLSVINALVPVFAHVSLMDPLKVAFTPDKASGEADRQVVTSLGKMLTKFYPGVQDQVISDFVSTHNADISDEIEWIEHDGIQAVYEAGTLGACMAKPSSGFKGAISPTMVYDTPGVRMAVLRNSYGEISARCLVYDASPTDKRFIRVYGDVTLLKRLAKHGYRPGRWHGLKFKTVQIAAEFADGESDWYAMPYLDGLSTMGSNESSWVALIDGVIESISYGTGLAINKISAGSTGCCTSTSGRIKLHSVNSALFSCTDYISGKQVSKFKQLKELLIDDTLHYTEEEIPAETFTYAYSYYNGNSVRHHIPNSEVIEVEYQRYAKKHLKAYGFSYLDSTLYPDRVDVPTKDYNLTATASGQIILTIDAIKIVADASESSIHQSDLVTTGKLKHVRLGVNVYALHDTKLYITPSGRKVHPSVHDVVKLYDGMYEFKRNAKAVMVLGTAVWLPRNLVVSTGSDSHIYKAIATKELEAFRWNIETGQNLTTATQQLYRNITGNSGVFRAGSYSRNSPDRTAPAAKQMELLRSTALYIGDYYGTVKHTMYAAEVAYAEMMAVEADVPVVEPAGVLVDAVDSRTALLTVINAPSTASRYVPLISSPNSITTTSNYAVVFDSSTCTTTATTAY